MPRGTQAGPPVLSQATATPTGASAPGQTLRPSQPEIGLSLGLPMTPPGKVALPQIARLSLLCHDPAQRQRQGGQ